MKKVEISEIPKQKRGLGWALILDGGQRTVIAFTDSGNIESAKSGNDARELIHKLGKSHVLFTNQPKAIAQICDARYCEIKVWGQRITDLRVEGKTKIVRSPQHDPPLDSFSYALAFETYAKWLTSLGLSFDRRAGWNTIGSRIWTLTDGFVKFKGMQYARLALYGGRKQAPFSAKFQQAQHFDISAAYLAALGFSTMPRRLQECQGKEWAIPNHDGIIYATVIVPPELEKWGPLPVRADHRIIRFLKFPVGEITGWWTFSELRMAVTEYGCTITDVTEQWGGRNEDRYFSQWAATMLRGRALPNGAAFFAKQHANLLWSRFSMTSAPVSWKTFKDEYGQQPIIIKKQERGRSFSDKSAFVGAITSSRVREKLYRDALCPNGYINRFAVHCDTDGIIVGTHHNLPYALKNIPTTVTPGEWRHTKMMPLVDIKNPNSYRYICQDCGWDHPYWHYVCAGSDNQESNKRRFEKTARSEDSVDLDKLDPETFDEEILNYVPRKRRRKFDK